MRRCIPLLVVLAMAGPASAFETELGFGGWVGFRLGAGWLDLSGVNDYFDPADVDAFGNTALTAGGELYGVLFDRLVLGGAGDFSYREESGPDLDVRLATSTFTLDGGYVLFDAGGFRGYPVFGIGVGAVNINLDGDYSTLPLAEQAGLSYVEIDGAGTARIAEDRNVDLNRSSFIAKAAFHLDYYYPFGGSEGGFAMVLTGLRVAAVGDIASSGWRLDGDSLRGSEPDFSYNGVFGSIVFAFGGGTPNVAPTPRRPAAPSPPPPPPAAPEAPEKSESEGR
ncbi:MAG: hypothetical protein M5R36_28225 [Deltaproteobacteria bacterium]|nr:hypothetical protein [Deltaproteobacteria bacterium]